MKRTSQTIFGICLVTLTAYEANANVRCEEITDEGAPANTRPAIPVEVKNEAVNDEAKPQNRQWVQHSDGKASFDLAEINKQLQKNIPAAKLANLRYHLYINGEDSPISYPWGTKSIVVSEPHFGQYDYYVVVKDSTAGGQGNQAVSDPTMNGDKLVSISDVAIRETHDSQNLNEVSFEEYLKPERKFGVKLNSALEKMGLSAELTAVAVEKGYGKVVWVLRPNADAGVETFVKAANLEDGLSVTLRMDASGNPTLAILKNRKTGQVLEADPKSFYFKLDAAFNGNAFFWDDMFVALATVPYHPWLARSTVEFWLDVQKMNNGVAPREPRKSNLKSLWFRKIVRPGQADTENLQYTNPYLIHWVAEKLYAYDPSTENEQLMMKVVDSMTAYTQWMEKNRSVYDKAKRFIGFTGNALGSGLDNSRGGRGNDHSPESYQSGWVDPLAQQISMYKSIHRWKTRASKQGDVKAAAEAKAAWDKVAFLENLLNTKYWNQEKGFYFDLIPDGRGGHKQDTRYYSIAGFWPLFSKSLRPEQLQRFISLQMTPDHFGSRFPFPANSLHSVLIDPKEDGYWDSVARWPSMATVSVEGLSEQGRPDLAFTHQVGFLRGMTEAFHRNNNHTVFEFYGDDGQFGRAGAHKGHETRGDFAGWGKVPPIYGMLENVIGLKPQLNGSLLWNVFVPMQVGETLEVSNYMYRGQLIKKLVLKKTGENHYSVHAEGSSTPKIEVVSYLTSQNELSATGHPVIMD